MESKDLIDKLREHAVAINLLGDEIFKLDKLTGREYQEFVKHTDIVALQCRRLLSFAWEKTQTK